MAEKISVFLSVAEPHNENQKLYLNELIKYLDNQGISAETLGRSFWSISNPLQPIQEKMAQVDGACILAMERYHAFNGVYKENSEQEYSKENQYFASIWTQLEGAMAYQEKLPLLILKEEKLVVEGMFDGQIHGWMIVKINPEDPTEILRNPIKGYIGSWMSEVRSRYYSKTSKKQ